jgi:hypothetical protein
MSWVVHHVSGIDGSLPRLPLNDPPPFSGDLEWTEVNVPEGTTGYFSISRDMTNHIFLFSYFRTFIDTSTGIALSRDTRNVMKEKNINVVANYKHLKLAILLGI